MELQKIETLLLQEMEEVKGGVDGTCKCDTGAGQSSKPGGNCECTKGGAGQLLEKHDTEPIKTCSCTGGALVIS